MITPLKKQDQRTNPQNPDDTPKPECLDEMLSVAEQLATGFHHVRVDFYLQKDGGLKVGELTFTSAGGTCLWNSEEWDLKLGKLIRLPVNFQKANDKVIQAGQIPTNEKDN